MTRTILLVPRRRDVMVARMHGRRDAWHEVQPDDEGRTAYLWERQHVAAAAAHRVAEEAVEALRDARVPLRHTGHMPAAPNPDTESRPCERAAASRTEARYAEAARLREYITESALERIGQIEAVQNRLASIYLRAWDRNSRHARAQLNAAIAVDRAGLPESLVGDGGSRQG